MGDDKHCQITIYLNENVIMNLTTLYNEYMLMKTFIDKWKGYSCSSEAGPNVHYWSPEVYPKYKISYERNKNHPGYTTTHFNRNIYFLCQDHFALVIMNRPGNPIHHW